MHFRISPAFLVALFAFLAVSINALPKFLNASPTPTPSISHSQMAAMTPMTPGAHPTPNAGGKPPGAQGEEGEEGSDTEWTATSSMADATVTVTATATPTADAKDALGLLDTLTELLSTLTRLLRL